VKREATTLRPGQSRECFMVWFGKADMGPLGNALWSGSAKLTWAP
jgi:hypothetical protein